MLQDHVIYVETFLDESRRLRIAWNFGHSFWIERKIGPCESELLCPYGELWSVGYQNIEIKQDRDFQIPDAKGELLYLYVCWAMLCYNNQTFLFYEYDCLKRRKLCSGSVFFGSASSPYLYDMTWREKRPILLPDRIDDLRYVRKESPCSFSFNKCCYFTFFINRLVFRRRD
jgi:hypothetical protein